MSTEGQGHFFTIYFPCFVLYLAKISGERLQDHWSSGFSVVLNGILFILTGNHDIHKSLDEFEIRLDPTTDHRVSCP